MMPSIWPAMHEQGVDAQVTARRLPLSAAGPPAARASECNRPGPGTEQHAAPDGGHIVVPPMHRNGADLLYFCVAGGPIRAGASVACRLKLSETRFWAAGSLSKDRPANGRVCITGRQDNDPYVDRYHRARACDSAANHGLCRHKQRGRRQYGLQQHRQRQQRQPQHRER